MKILLVRPKVPSSIEREEPLGILYIAAYLKEKMPSIKIDIVDAHALRISEEEMVKKIIIGKYDAILISVLTIGASYAYQITKKCKKIYPELIFIFGGAHATALPRECLDNGADFCVLGEGEITTLELLDTLNKKNDVSEVDGIAYLERDEMIKTKTRRLISNLSILPFPEYSLLEERNNYNTTIHALNADNKALPIIASRGCVNNCPFCSSNLIWKRKLRFRTVKNVLDEIEYNISKNGIREYHFYDDDFLVNRKFLKEFCNEMNYRNIKIKYCCLSTCKSVLALSDDELDMLKDSGLTMIEVGIESLIPKVLLYLKKTYIIEEVPMLVQKVNAHKLALHPLLMYMIPNETLTAHSSQSKFFLSTLSNIPYVQDEWKVDEFVFLNYAAAYTPLPGTDFLDNVNNYGVFFSKSWDELNTEKITFIPYSLLNDIPVKSMIIIDDKVMQRGIVQIEQTLQISIRGEQEHLIAYLLEQVDGVNNVRQISQKIYIKFGGIFNSHKESIIFTIITLIVFAVLDVVKSKEK